MLLEDEMKEWDPYIRKKCKYDSIDFYICSIVKWVNFANQNKYLYPYRPYNDHLI